jgi:cellulose synthase/poly-beta-1,6-N-acetylglucosamine synthase-like glycosyltransferase
MLLLLALLILAGIYYIFDPANGLAFPKCPFMMLTGLECPGCGSQRAIHQLLHLNPWAAMKENFLMVVSIPYVVTGFAIDFFGTRSVKAQRIRSKYYGSKAAIAALAAIILFWIIRNLL